MQNKTFEDRPMVFLGECFNGHCGVVILKSLNPKLRALKYFNVVGFLHFKWKGGNSLKWEWEDWVLALKEWMILLYGMWNA